MREAKDRALFDALGFHWQRGRVAVNMPVHPQQRVCFRFYKMLPEFVWDAAVLEGNPFTFPEIKTLLDGITVGGRKVSDQEQVLNLARSSRHLLALVKNGGFAVTKPVFTEIHGLVARNEALEWGVFRGEGQERHYTPDVLLGEHGRDGSSEIITAASRRGGFGCCARRKAQPGWWPGEHLQRRTAPNSTNACGAVIISELPYTPLPTVAAAPALKRLFAQGMAALQECPPFERACAFFLFGALQQFFFDGNKRTARLMMNGILMTHGIDAISIPAARAQEFNEEMLRFYLDKNADGMMAFLAACHPGNL